MKTLLPYQEEGARFLASNKFAMLADEAGLGKTLQAIRACDHVGAAKVLVVCPPSVVVNWKREFDDSSLLGPDVTITTPRKLQDMVFKDEELFDVLILDEAHYYKNHRSKRTQRVYGRRCEGDGLAELAKHVFLLTGSPMPNDPSEIWPHLHALRPELIPGRKGAMAFTHFQQVFCEVRQTPFGPKIVGVRPSKAGMLRDILSGFMLRRLDTEVDLPELRISPLYIDATVMRSDKGSEAAKVREVLEAEGVRGLKSLSPYIATLRRVLGTTKVVPTVEYTKEWLESNPGKICLYAWHKEVIEKLHLAFRSQAALITGSTTDRQSQVDKFQNDPECRVFVGQIQAAGEAITLTEASEILLVEPSWVPKDNYQAIKRIHRIGQTATCAARFVTVPGSIDEDINRALARKEAMIGAVIES